MKIINNKQEFNDFYYYKTDKNKKYPKEYPCIVEQISCDGGLMGAYMHHEIVYFPKNVDKESYLLGYIKGREIQL